jgi:hypothetical protein
LRLLIIVFAMGMAGAQPFSHRLHLKLNLQCTGCHSAAAASTSVVDNKRPSKQACQGCHKDVTIPPPQPVKISTFSHKQHLAFGNVAPLIAKAIDSKNYLSDPNDIRRHLNSNNACIACHRGLEESDAVTHAAMPQMADCLVCHTKIDPPFSCETCHARNANLKPASHTADFIDRHPKELEALGKTTCAVCHARRFTCMGCHS